MKSIYMCQKHWKNHKTIFSGHPWTAPFVAKFMDDSNEGLSEENAKPESQIENLLLQRSGSLPLL